MNAQMPVIKMDRCGGVFVPMLRWMERRDKERILEIEALSFDKPWNWDDFFRTLRNRDCHAEVVEIRREVAAYSVYELKGRTISILNLAVSPHIRRRGLGQILVHRLMMLLDDRRRRSLEAIVAEKNTEAQFFFRALGFRATIKPKHFGDGQDGYRFVYRVRKGDAGDLL